MSHTEAVTANYTNTGVARFKGNPFIEALPPLEKTKDDFLTALSHYPPIPTAQDRREGEITRIMALSDVNDIVYPFPEYQKAGIALATIMRDTYVARNPMSASDRQRRHALATEGKTGVPFPSDWKSSAKGHFMMAVSGMGKTTFARAFLLRYPQVIRHTSYQGQPLQCVQVVYLMLRVPHDATLKSLCLQFFEEIDKLLETNYMRQARSLGQIAAMVQLMNRVATAVSLGLLVIDEVQNLKNARGEHADHMLNLFSEIVERLGISILVVATPAVQAVVEKSVRNARKLASYGETVLSPMTKGDLLWNDFCDTYWDYSFVKKKTKLTDEIRNTWYDVSGGNTAFAVLAFMLTQRNEIGNSETIDAAAFQRTAAVDMSFLQPAITALRSRDPNRLREFDDLLLSPRYMALRKLLGARDLSEHPFERPNAETDSMDLVRSSRRVPRNAPLEAFDGYLPMEDPLAKS